MLRLAIVLPMLSIARPHSHGEFTRVRKPAHPLLQDRHVWGPKGEQRLFDPADPAQAKEFNELFVKLTDHHWYDRPFHPLPLALDLEPIADCGLRIADCRAPAATKPVTPSAEELMAQDVDIQQPEVAAEVAPEVIDSGELDLDPIADCPEPAAPAPVRPKRSHQKKPRRELATA